MTRETHRVFTDGNKRVPLALEPSAVGVAYPIRPVESVASMDGTIAVVCIEGPLESKGGDSFWFCWDNYESIVSRVSSAMASDKTTAVVLKFDSPGGDAAGCFEASKIIKGLRRQWGKPLYGYVDEACFSAAYALATACDEIYMPEAAGCGSIGVITVMAEMSERDKRDGFRFEVIKSGERKADGHPHAPMTDGAIARTQARVDALAAQFYELVANARGMSVEDVASLEAGCLFGADAVTAGLADGVMSFADFLTSIRGMHQSGAETLTPEGQPMAKQLAAMKALNDAHAALTAAKGESARALAAANLLRAEAAYKKAAGDSAEEEEDMEDPSEEEEAESAADDEGDDEEESTEGEDDDAAATGLHTKDRLLRHAREITGKRTIEEVMGALTAMWHSHKRADKMQAAIARLEKESNDAKMAALIDAGVKAGKIAPSEKSRAWAASLTPKQLTAYLDAATPIVHTEATEHTEAPTKGNEAKVSAAQLKIWRKLGMNDADIARASAALLAQTVGDSPEKVN